MLITRVNDAKAEKITPLVHVADRDYKDTFKSNLGTAPQPLKYTRNPATLDMNYTYGSRPAEVGPRLRPRVYALPY